MVTRIVMSNQQKVYTILIVDDQPENIDVLSSILRNEYKIKAAKNGERALDILFNKELPDLIMMDVMMPGIDGFEVCKKLKQDDRTKHIPVIFVSALDNEDDRIMAYTSGGIDYISKPVKPDEVREKVHTYITYKSENEIV